MARKRRDYRAEYQRSKARANAAGYQSERDYRAARKRLGVKGRGVMPVPKRVATAIISAGTPRDDASRLWSNRHSRVIESLWDDSYDEPTRENYYNAYTKPLRNRAKWRKAHRDFLVPRFYTAKEYDDRYRSGEFATTAA